MRHPLVSVIITCYNYADYIEESIESVLQQTYENIEIIVIDDGSTDNSLKIIEKYSSQIRIITRKNKGIVYTRNEGVQKSKGEYLCFLDADDYFDNTYIEEMLSIARKSRADVVYPNWRIFGDQDRIVYFKEFNLKRLARQEIHCTSESMIKKSAIGESVFESETVAEDWDFFLNLALKGCRFKLASKCFINYRVRNNTRSSQRSYWDDVRHFVKILEKWQKLYPDKINPVELPIYAGMKRDEHIESQDRIIEKIGTDLESVTLVNAQLCQEINLANQRCLELQNSKSYNTGRVVLYPFRVAKRLLSIAKMTVQGSYESQSIDKKYASQLKSTRILSEADSSKIAVVIHLYYLDNWPLFERKLKLLPRGRYDIFITLPENNQDFIPNIKNDFSDATIIISPNRGRDVLPFTKVANELYRGGYRTVLKFHSKKSTHRTDGQDWLESMLDQIIPDDPKALSRVIRATEKSNFGLLGPADVYYPLTINFPANGVHLTDVVSRLFTDKAAKEVLQQDRAKYGFFGGTMFWANLESVEELIGYGAAYFEPEEGQIDGTFAHALERLFCLVPEVNGKNIYESDGRAVRLRDYRSDNIPEWSEDHNK